jgi:uncharacterized protein YqgV (UPF0045/DUF77 family)
VIVEIQCLPSPMGTPESKYAHIEAAIAVIEAAGLTYEVGALGTTIEGEPDQLWPLVRQVHEACLRAGAGSVVSVIKVAEAATIADQATIGSLTGKFRD